MVLGPGSLIFLFPFIFFRMMMTESSESVEWLVDSNWRRWTMVKGDDVACTMKLEPELLDDVRDRFAVN